MEQINVSELAKKLNTKTDLLITKLKLIGIEASALSKLDEITVLKATLMLIDTPRVEDIAKTLNLASSKVIEKFASLGINVFSKISIVSQEELVKFLKLEDFSSLKVSNEDKAAVIKTSLPKKAREKRIRFKTVAAQFPNVSEKTMLSHLNEMHVFITDGNTLLDEATANELKERLYSSLAMSNVVSNKIKNTSTVINNSFWAVVKSVKFAAILAMLCIACLSFLSASNFIKMLNYPKWRVADFNMPLFKTSSETAQKVGQLEIHKSDLRIPISFEGADVTELFPTLLLSRKSSVPGTKGITVLNDYSGGTYDKFFELNPGDVLIIKTIDQKNFYYMVTAGDVYKDIKTLPLKSALVIQTHKDNKTLEVQAILQKHRL